MVTDRRARFCGRCGGTLIAEVDGTSPRRRRPVSRGVLLGSGILVATAVVTAMLMGTDLMDVSWPDTVEGDAEVAVTEQGSGEPIQPAGEVDGDIAAALREQLDPDALRCQPRGCQRWRLPFARSWSLTGRDGDRLGFVRDHHAPWPEAEDADGVLADGGAEVLVVDMTTGEEVFRRVLDRARSVDDVGDISRRWEVLRVHLFGSSVVVVGDRTVTTFGERGEVLWSRPFEGSHHGMVDGTLISSDEAAAGYTIRGHDAQDGSERWSRASVVVPRILDVEGLVAVVPDPSEQVTRLIDAATGGDVAEIDGRLVTGARTEAGVTVVLTRGQDLEVVAFDVDRDADPLWRVALEDRIVGDVWLSLPVDGDRITIGHDAGQIDLALEDGARLRPEESEDSSQAEGWTDALGREWQTPDDGFRLTAGDRWVEVTGRDLWLVSDDPLVVSDGVTLMGVQLVPGG